MCIMVSGKRAVIVQVQELGTLETPIALTNTLNVGKCGGCHDFLDDTADQKEGEDVFLSIRLSENVMIRESMRFVTG